MERDATVILMGEDIAGGSGTDGQLDAWGGVLGVTKGLWGKFGDRVMDTPITESAFVGAAVGAATAGLRPVVELMFVDFMGVCFDQIFNQAAKFRYMFGGKATTPLVIRTMCGAGSVRRRSTRSACIRSSPTSPVSSASFRPRRTMPRACLIQAIRDNDPVIFFEHKLLYSMQGEVPEEPYAIPFGEVRFAREGQDVTVVTLGRMVHVVEEAAATLAGTGCECEVSISGPPRRSTRTAFSKASPRRDAWSWSTKPRRAATSPPTSRRWWRNTAFGSLKAPIRMVTPPHTPVPFSDTLEDLYIPNAASVARAICETMGYAA